MQKLPQLTLRDLFWLVALVAMGCGWWVEHSGHNAWRMRAMILKRHIERWDTEDIEVEFLQNHIVISGGLVGYSYSLSDSP